MPGRLRQAFAATRTPADVRAVLDESPGERLLSWGRDDTGDPVVATDKGLHAYGDRLAWAEIDRVLWRDGVLAILAIDGETRNLPLPEDRDLPAVIRAEVEGSVVTSQAVPLLADGRGVTIIARRGADGAIGWRLRYDQGLSGEDPELRARAEQALAQIRTELGI